MRKQSFFFLLSLVLLAVAGCDTLTVNVKGEGPVVVADQTPGTDFTKLLISIPGNVYITEGPERKVTLIAQENVMEAIQTGITGNDEIGYTFELKTKKTIKRFDSLSLYITVPDLINLSINSNAVVVATNDWDFPLLTMTQNGSGSITLPRLSGDVLAMDLPGSGTISIENGAVTDLSVKMNGSGAANLTGMRSQEASVNVTGSGIVRVNAVQGLKVTISGSGNVEYKGNPFVEQNITGTGTLKKI